MTNPLTAAYQKIQTLEKKIKTLKNEIKIIKRIKKM